jgi:hypothetical protein
MPKRARKPKLPDPMGFALALVEGVTGEKLVDRPDPAAGKNPAAVALGKLGGAKGGKARAAAMTKKERVAAAKKAAAARWNQEPQA